MKAVVLVEGESDRIAVERLAARRGRDLAAEGIAVVAVGGAHALERALWALEAERVAGLYDRLDRLLSRPSHLSVHDLQSNPLWDPIRGHPRFKALLAKYDHQ